jgi:hypothetical protein
MEREPQPLTDARFLLARVGTDTPPSRAELVGLRDRMRTMRAHPSCDVVRAERLSGALLVLDVLLLAAGDVTSSEALVS